jgi:hypothetical protein
LNKNPITLNKSPKTQLLRSNFKENAKKNDFEDSKHPYIEEITLDISNKNTEALTKDKKTSSGVNLKKVKLENKVTPSI